MILLILGLAIFIAVHLLPVFAKSRHDALVAKFGEAPWKGIAALILTGSVVLMVLGYQQADFIAVWTPPGFMVHINNLLMIIAIVFFFAGRAPGNIKCYTRHPQLNGLKTWAVAHLLVNGDLASIILFGGLLGWGVAAMVGSNIRDGKGPMPEKGPWAPTLIHLGLSAVAFAIITGVHSWLGVWPFPN